MLEKIRVCHISQLISPNKEEFKDLILINSDINLNDSEITHGIINEIDYKESCYIVFILFKNSSSILELFFENVLKKFSDYMRPNEFVPKNTQKKRVWKKLISKPVSYQGFLLQTTFYNLVLHLFFFSLLLMIIITP